MQLFQLPGQTCLGRRPIFKNCLSDISTNFSSLDLINLGWLLFCVASKKFWRKGSGHFSLNLGLICLYLGYLQSSIASDICREWCGADITQTYSLVGRIDGEWNAKMFIEYAAILNEENFDPQMTKELLPKKGICQCQVQVW